MKITLLAMTRLVVLVALAAGTRALAQGKVDVAVTYAAERANVTGNCGCFWLQGGGVEAGATLWHGLGVEASLTGTHNGSTGSQGVALGLITATFGPRYRYKFADKPVSVVKLKDVVVFGEGLVGTVHGFDSIFPSIKGSQPTSFALATQLGGGIDVGLTSHLAIRPIELGWMRTRLPNSTNNTQNDLRINAGVVIRFGRNH